MKELSKEEAIRLHREMWNWIAEQAGDYIIFLKRKFLREVKNITSGESPLSNICKFCPLVWGTEDKKVRMYCCNDFYSFYRDSPRHIANLPEKEGV